MGTVGGSEGLKLKTEYRLRRNRFAGCIDMGCPMLGTCSKRYQHTACPFGDEAFEAHNPRDREAVGQNTILDTLLDWFADNIAGVANSFDPEATHISVGTGTAPTDGTMTQLQSEVYRDTFVDRTRTATGKVTFYWFFGPGVVTGTLTEWAFIANGATLTLGTGDAINRFLQTLSSVVSSDCVVGQYSILGA